MSSTPPSKPATVDQPALAALELPEDDAGALPAAESTEGAAPAQARLSTPSRGRTVLSRYSLLGVWAAMAILYCVLMPNTFASISTAQTIFGSQSALLLLALAGLSTFLVGEFDLSFASVMGLSATIVPVLTTVYDVPIALSCLVAMLAAIACGVLNAVFVVVLKVPSLIVTLGTASLFLGISQLISGASIVSVSDPGFATIANGQLLGLPYSFYYGLILTLVFAYVLAWTPLGRHIVFVGANREVARLAGIPVNKIRAGSYLVASVVAGAAGLLLVMMVGGFDPTASATYLLPALAAVFLGTAMVQPGQFNPMGTFFGIYFLATGILGLQLLGYSGWVQDAFYGAGLVIAVTVASIVRERTKVS